MKSRQFGIEIHSENFVSIKMPSDYAKKKAAKKKEAVKVKLGKKAGPKE